LYNRRMGLGIPRAAASAEFRTPQYLARFTLLLWTAVGQALGPPPLQAEGPPPLPCSGWASGLPSPTECPLHPAEKCFAHFLRELGRLQREKKRGAVRFPRELVGLLREALAWRAEKGRREPAGFEARLQELEAKLDARIAEKRRFTDGDHARWARRLRKRRRHLLWFLRVEGVEATHNRAERALRPAVLVRHKTRRGARTHAVWASLLPTLRQPGRETLTYRISVRTAPARLPPLLPPPLWDTS
jgi:hypothetical protein